MRSTVTLPDVARLAGLAAARAAAVRVRVMTAAVRTAAAVQEVQETRQAMVIEAVSEVSLATAKLSPWH